MFSYAHYPASPTDALTQLIDTDVASQVRSRTSTLSQPFTPSLHHAPDSPTTSLIGTLRSQLEMYAQQTEQLNAKLVASISKHADLEDTIFALQEDKNALTRDNGELARAKAQWEESMNTGLLVERSQIRDEMQRLAAGLVEEERKRGTAEEKRKQVEDEVDELSATLFDQVS
jgi:septal ring factor EnvC (AmiA/AmiB activator)